MTKTKKVISMATTRLAPLPVGIPPDWWERAIGYRGDERYLALYYVGRVLHYDDGATFHRAVREPWLLWHNWRGHQALLAPLGIKSGAAWMLMDRVTRQAWHGIRELVIPILLAQWPPLGGAPTGTLPWPIIRDEVMAQMDEWLACSGNRMR